MKDVAVYFTQQGVKFCEVWHIMVFFSGTLIWYHTHIHTQTQIHTHTNTYYTHPANTSTLNRRWNNVDRQASSMLFQRWYLVENESWGDKHFSKLFQCWQNNVETTSIKLHQFNVDDPTLFQHWYLVEDESWANVCLSTLGIFTKQWVNNKTPACIYMFKVNNRNTRTRCEICWKSTINMFHTLF